MSNRKATKMVFFDAAGTLFDVRGSVGEIYARFALLHGKEVDPKAVQNEFIRQFPQQPPMAFARDLTRNERLRQEKQWWRKLVQDVFAGFGEFPQVEDYFVEIFEYFRTTAAWTLRPDTRPTLDAIRRQGLRTGLISNFDSRLYDLLEAFDLRRSFDSIHISSEVGAAKPDAAIFEAALQDNQIEPSGALHLGDSFGEDVRGAQAAGIRAVWLNPQSAHRTATDVVQVLNLQEILDLL
ncbi:MAG: HAD-IA family hydrolase [Acidobacteria bacterium]|nr:HAD-IA family hydrolase [Acidobacteriota bacterium]